MGIKDNCLECPHCGTLFVSLYYGAIDSDVACVQLSDLLKELEKNKKGFNISGGTISSGSVDDIIASSSAKIAQDELKAENYDAAYKYASSMSGIEAVRIKFLAWNRCKNESYLSDRCVWGQLKSDSVPEELCNSEAYGDFYSSFVEYCKVREQAAYESNAIVLDYIQKYIFLDARIKAASGDAIYEALKNRTKDLCKRCSVFPEPWLAFKLFDNNAISKMVGVLQDTSVPYLTLLNWSNNHFIGTGINIEDDNYYYKLTFSPSEISVIKNAMSRLYPGFSYKGRAGFVESYNKNVGERHTVAVQIDNSVLAYPRVLANRAKNAAANANRIVGKYKGNPANHSIWTYAGVKNTDSHLWRWDAYWVKTKHSVIKKDYASGITNFDYKGNNLIQDNEIDAFVELLYYSLVEIGYPWLTVAMEKDDYNFAGRGRLPKYKTIAELFKITLWW